MATYACSDLHSQTLLYKKIKAFLNPEDKVYFLGDAADRGQKGWELIKTIYNDPQFIYLKGNHEDMLVQAGREYYQNDERIGKWGRILFKNGGYETFNDWLSERQDFGLEWLKLLDKLPEEDIYENELGFVIHLSHAGGTPMQNEEGNWVFSDDLIWDRSHFTDIWPIGAGNLICVHGHTPNCYVHEELHPEVEDANIEIGAYWYCNNHKICLDCAAFATDMTVLLNLDTFDEHIFEIYEDEKQ